MRSEKGSVGTAEFSEDQRVVGDEESGDRHIDSLTALIGGRYFVIISCSLGSVLYAGPIPLTDPPAVTAKGAARVVTCAVDLPLAVTRSDGLGNDRHHSFRDHR